MMTSIRAPEALTPRVAARIRRLYFRRLAPQQRRVLSEVSRAAAGADLRVYLVGGAVRDLLLRRPLRDLDLAVDGDALALAHRLGRPHRPHEAFGTTTVSFDDGTTVDLATTRRERYRKPAALPEVEPADLLADLARRDFTVNALALPLLPRGPGGVIDPFGGLEDLRARTLRVLHVGSFADDPTRAFRAVRLAAELGFSLEATTEARMRADRDKIDRLSSTRLRRELIQLLDSRHAGHALAEGARLGLLRFVDPAPRPTCRTKVAMERASRVLSWYRESFPAERLVSWVIALALLLRAADERRLGQVVSRLQPDRSARRLLIDGVHALQRVPRRLVGGVRLPPSRLHAICRPHATEGLLAVLAASESAAQRRALRSYLTELREVRPEIRGSDLLRAGVIPGPAVARGLDAALRARLDGQALDRSAQLEVALRAAGRP